MTRNRIIPLKEVSEALGRTPKTIWRWWAKEKTFPKPILMNGRCLGWRESELDNWMESKGEGKK